MRWGDEGWFYLPFGRFAEGLGGERIWVGTSEAILVDIKLMMLSS